MVFHISLKMDVSGFSKDISGTHLIAKTSGAIPEANPPRDIAHQHLKDLCSKKGQASWSIVEFLPRGDRLKIVVRSSARPIYNKQLGRGTNYTVLEIDGTIEEFKADECRFAVLHLINGYGVWNHLLELFFEDIKAVNLDTFFEAAEEVTSNMSSQELQIRRDQSEKLFLVDVDQITRVVPELVKNAKNEIRVIFGPIDLMASVWPKEWDNTRPITLVNKKPPTKHTNNANVTNPNLDKIVELARIIDANIAMLSELKRMKRNKMIRFCSTHEVDKEIENTEHALLEFSALQKRMIWKGNE